MLCSFPPSLPDKGTIGIVSPSMWLRPESVQKAKVYFEKQGYQVVIHAQAYLKEGWLAGSDAARAEAIMDMFADKTIDAILCSRGGTGATRILDLLDYDVIRQNPKPFVGFSDTTALLHAISRRAGLVTFHGPAAGAFTREENDPRTDADFLYVLGTEGNELTLTYDQVEPVVLGEAEGTLLGGNMLLLQNLIGTDYDWYGKDSILFLEETETPLHALDRQLQHFAMAHKFEGVRAVIVGKMKGFEEAEAKAIEEKGLAYGKDFKTLLQERIPSDIPLVMGFPCGHGGYNTTLPLGATVHLKVAETGAELKFSKTV